MNEEFTWISKVDTLEVSSITNVFFATPPRGNHIRIAEGGKMALTEVTLFAGYLSHWAAIRWGFLGLLKLGPIRVNRFKALIGWALR